MDPNSLKQGGCLCKPFICIGLCLSYGSAPSLRVNNHLRQSYLLGYVNHSRLAQIPGVPSPSVDLYKMMMNSLFLYVDGLLEMWK
jgi:hypothetical protein